MTPAGRKQQQEQRAREPFLIIDLFRADFSTEEIRRLCRLRDRYPVDDHLSRAERERLAFLKWRLQQGEITR